jgi:hypothetical protein
VSASVYMSRGFQGFWLALAALSGAAPASRRIPQRRAPPAEPASGRPHPIHRQRSAQGPDRQGNEVGVYLNVQPNFTAGTLPALRLLASPANGTIGIERGEMTATN